MSPANRLRALIHEICGFKKTGALTINFSQGSVSGTLQWRENENNSLTGKEKCDLTRLK